MEISFYSRHKTRFTAGTTVNHKKYNCITKRHADFRILRTTMLSWLFAYESFQESFISCRNKYVSCDRLHKMVCKLAWCIDFTAVNLYALSLWLLKLVSNIKNKWNYGVYIDKKEVFGFTSLFLAWWYKQLYANTTQKKNRLNKPLTKQATT